ncbi:MAG: DUF5671 domain-containing protein [bacterium]|nr:DUF5671 domain-containing protein [bacterium]
MDNLSTQARPKSTPKDVFLHLLVMVALYFSAGSFIALIFQYINVLIPDPLDSRGYYAVDSAYRTIRFSISALIVVFPAYLLLTKYLNKLYEREPEKRNLGSRKFLIWLTLSIAGVIMVGDLVGLVNALLGGELTMRFLLKVVTLLFVAGSVFYYYFTDLRKYKTE